MRITSLLQKNERVPRSWPALCVDTVVTTAKLCVLGWAILGWLVHLVVFPLVSYTPAGFVACPLQCETCQGPGRAFAWNFKGSWREEKGQMGHALVCHNPKYDADKLSYGEVRASLNAELQPYMVSSIASYMVEGVMVCGSISLSMGLFWTGKRRRKLDLLRAALEQRRAAARTRLAELRGDGPRPEPTSPFR